MRGKERTYKTRGIVLSRREIGEADRLLSVFTIDHGIIRLKAKGVRKIKSKMAGHLELYTESDLFIAKGHKDDVLAGAKSKALPDKIRANLKLLSRAALISEFALAVIPAGIPQEELYDLTRFALQNLDGEDERIAAYYLWRLLTMSGFISDIEGCAVCGKPHEPGAVRFLIHEARFTHARCAEGRRVSDGTLKLVRLLARGEWRTVKAVRIAEADLAESVDLASLYLAETLNRPLTSASFMKQVRI